MACTSLLIQQIPDCILKVSALIHAVLVLKDNQEHVPVAFKVINSRLDYHFYNLALVYLHVTSEGTMIT
jgi:hypothetical protein